MWTPRSLSAETRHHLALLGQCLAGAGSPFVTWGELPLPLGVTLRFRDGHTVPLSPDDREAPTELIAFCAPAPFGDGTSTRYDPRIRRALQCNAEDGRFVVEGFDPAATGVLETVRQALCPDDPNPLRAELYAVNVYPRGGHFARHKDTPRGPDMLGTLVLCVARSFRGGDLTLTRGSDTQRVVFQSEGFGPEVVRSRWAAFFGDVDHAVEEVTSGERVTLTWLLRRTEGVPRAKNTRESDAFTQHLRAALRDPDFARVDDLTMAIPCVQLYAGMPGFVREVPPLDARSVLRLKGRDQTLAAAMLELGLDVALKPMLVDRSCDLYWTLARFPPPKALALFDNDRVTDTDIDKAFDVEERPGDQRVAWLTRAVDDGAQKADREAATEFLGAPEYSNTGYFGNEGGDGEFYLHAALVVKVPVTGTAVRKRIVAALPGAKEPAKTKPSAKTADTKEPAAPKPTPAKPEKAPVATPAKTPTAPVATPAKTPTAPVATPAKTPTAPPAKVEPPPPSTAKPAPMLDAKREYMASELHALGYTPATLRKALADGTLERSGFGWYRAGKSA